MKVWQLLVMIGLVLPVRAIAYHSTQDTITARVTDKDRVDGTYLVFTDSETFKNTDELIFFKFNSSDVYGQLEEGRTYQFRVVGWRIPFLSTYRNVLAIEEPGV